MSTRDLLRRRREETINQYGDIRNDYANELYKGAASAEEISRVRNLQRMGEMTGGFGQSQERAITRGLTENTGQLNREYNENINAVNTEYKLQDEYLKKQQEEQEKEARKAKLGSILKTGGTILGAAAAPFTGGASLSLGSTLGEIGNTLYGTGEMPNIDLSFVGDYSNWKKNRGLQKKAKLNPNSLTNRMGNRLSPVFNPLGE